MDMNLDNPKPITEYAAEAKRRREQEARKEAILEKVRLLKEKHKASAKARQAKYRRNLGKRGLQKVTMIVDKELLASLDAYAAIARISRGRALSDVLGGAFGRE